MSRVGGLSADRPGLKPAGRDSGLGRLWRAAALALSVALASSAWAETGVIDSGLTASLGPARIKLLTPAGLIHIDGLEPRVDEILAAVRAPGAEILAVYAEPRTWREYLKGVNGLGPRVSLDFYAYLAAPALPPEESVSPEDFERFKALTLQYGGELKVLDDQPRCLTYQVALTRLNDNGRLVRADQITTLILVEGKILTLNTFSNDLNRAPSQFVPSALGWRDAYRELTRP